MIERIQNHWAGCVCSKWWGAIAGLAFGAALSWYINAPVQPWMQFDWLEASYKEGAEKIGLAGHYEVNRECRPVSGGQMVWRTEALATDGQIASYGPIQSVPELTEGLHNYIGEILLTKQIYPDGWRVTIIITCPGEVPETVVSPSAKVQLVSSVGLSKGGELWRWSWTKSAIAR